MCPISELIRIPWNIELVLASLMNDPKVINSNKVTFGGNMYAKSKSKFIWRRNVSIKPTEHIKTCFVKDTDIFTGPKEFVLDMKI